MTAPGDAVRQKAEAWQAANWPAPCCDRSNTNVAAYEAFVAGHAEGRAEGLEWAVSKYCRNKHDAECYNHETCPCERCCHYRPIHRELARLRGGK